MSLDIESYCWHHAYYRHRGLLLASQVIAVIGGYCQRCGLLLTPGLLLSSGVIVEAGVIAAIGGIAAIGDYC